MCAKSEDPIVKLIDYTLHTTYEDLPADVVETIKKAILDTAGAGIAGSTSPVGKLASEMARDYGGKPEATVWVYGDRVPAPEAGFVNGWMARCLEIDDVNEGSPRLGDGHVGHVSVMTVPAVMALAESMDRPVSGKEIITAIAIGGDLISRLRVAGGKGSQVGWESPTVAPLAVAAAAGKLLGFDAETMANAMGAAYTHCCGNIQATTDGAWDTWLNVGVAVRGGLIAAELARRGHHGTRAPLLGKSGLFNTYFRGEYHEDTLLKDLGTVFESGNVSVKPYSCCKCAHYGIYSTVELVKRHNIKPEEIESIKITTDDYTVRLTVMNELGKPKYEPRTTSEAQFSMPFAIATHLLKGAVWPDVITEENIRDPKILELSRKVQVEISPEKNALALQGGYPPDDVEIRTKDGKVYFGSEPYVIGHPKNPMYFEEVQEKFERCVRLCKYPLNRAKLDRFVQRVRFLEAIEDARYLFREMQ